MSWIEGMLRLAVEKGASDLHLSSGRKPMLRVNGDLYVLDDQPTLDPDNLTAEIKKLAPPQKWKEYEEKKDTDFAYEFKNESRFRCNFYVDHQGPGAAMRVIPDKVPTVKELLLPNSVVELCHLKKGLVLVTGPTGCGKSTSLAALINYINESRRDHIITIEDPIEFIYPEKKCLINQREVYRHTESFASALRAALREDPDVVLIGELRDLETVRIALETAETGHLIFGTLHTDTAASAVDRLIEEFPADEQNRIRVMLSTSLKAVMSQTLCKRRTGGRIGAYEVLLITPAVAVNIREAKTMMIANAMETGQAQGMCVLNDSLIEYVRRGWVDPMEAYIRAGNRKEFLVKLKENGVHLDLSKVTAS